MNVEQLANLSTNKSALQQVKSFQENKLVLDDPTPELSVDGDKTVSANIEAESAKKRNIGADAYEKLKNMLDVGGKERCNKNDVFECLNAAVDRMIGGPRRPEGFDQRLMVVADSLASSKPDSSARRGALEELGELLDECKVGLDKEHADSSAAALKEDVIWRDLHSLDEKIKEETLPRETTAPVQSVEQPQKNSIPGKSGFTKENLVYLMSQCDGFHEVAGSA